jgi:uncharacterized protein (DUF1501 family)
MSNINSSRRSFLKQGGALSAGGVIGPSWMLNLAAMADASAAIATDYKALVCVFLEGGNDACNTILPPDGSKSLIRYNAVRSKAALDFNKGTFAPLSFGTPLDKTFRLHPKLTEVAALYKSKKLAVVANVGNILKPTTRDLFTAQTSIPPRQSGRSNMESTGWGGRYLDNDTYSGLRSVVVGDNNKFSVGDKVQAYGMVPKIGVVPLLPTAANKTVFGNLPVSTVEKVIQGNFKSARPNLIEQDYAKLVTNALALQKTMGPIMAANPDFGQADKPNSTLAEDLLVVAKTIAGQCVTGRQVFFVSLRGFDTHSDQAKHTALMAELSLSLNYFYKLLTEIKAADKVVTFTASDFGRLLHGNGDGADHGWGGHQLVMGDALVGKAGGTIIGRVPSYEHNGTDYVDQQMTADGAMIPEISIQSYAAALGQWFEVSNIASVFTTPSTNTLLLAPFANTAFTDGKGVLKDLLPAPTAVV